MSLAGVSDKHSFVIRGGNLSGGGQKGRGEVRRGVGGGRWDGDNICQLHLGYAGVTWSPTHPGELGCLQISHGSILGRRGLLVNDSRSTSIVSQIVMR